MRLTDAEVARATVTTKSLLETPMWGVGVERMPPVFLPEPRPSWQIAAGLVPTVAHLTPATVGELVECPLRWVLGQAPGLRASSFPALPHGALLNGILGHYLIQRLVEAGTLDAPRDEIERVIDALIPETAASLLQPGMGFELLQLRDQLVRTVAALVHVLHQGGLATVACEEELEAPWLGVSIKGRLDLRLRGPGDREVILDLKWGTRTYRELLHAGRAVQLAVYVHLRHHVDGARPAAGYFSLSRGSLMTTDPEAFGASSSIDGPRLLQTVEQLAVTLPHVLRVLGEGHIPVTGVHRSLPLMDSLGIPANQHAHHYPAQPGGGCDYCRFAPLCGRAWETRS